LFCFRESRSWILNVLYQGLKGEGDWALANRLPVVKFLCSSFLFETVKTQRTILGILRHGAALAPVASTLSLKHALPLWIANIHSTSRALRADLDLLFQTLLAATPPSTDRDRLFNYVKLKLESQAPLSAPDPEPDTQEEEDHLLPPESIFN
jgi:hypothetical protein